MRDHDKLLSLVSNPDLQLLLPKYPDLNQILSDAFSTIDYSNSNSPYILSTILAKEFFDLDIYLDKSHLCPRIPNRLDYILWISRLLESYKSNSEDLIGLDIGTGSSCIYPLLACSLFPEWRFYGTDINSDSIGHAIENVKRNQHKVDNRITVLSVNAHDKLFPIDEIAQSVMFTMCNPPFYENIEEIKNRRDLKAQAPRTLELWAIDSELFTKGGELKFTLRMIEDSLKLRDKIAWYTTMVGKKETLIKLVGKLREYKIHNYAIHEIVPGKTTRRWTVGWSFAYFHPRRRDSRVETASIKTLNPVPTEVHITRSNSTISPSKSKKLKIDISHQLETIFEGFIESPHFSFHHETDNCIIVDFTIPIWSRSYRRALAAGREIDINDTTTIQLDITEDYITVWWKYGSDYVLFESFCGMLKKHVI